LNGGRKALVKFSIAMSFVRQIVGGFRDIVIEKIEALDDLQNKQAALDAEAQSARASFNFMKARISNKDAEISHLEKEIQ
jgi:hypothetical protein